MTSVTSVATERRRVLFVAEAVTLAHVARARVLAESLEQAGFDVHAAWDPRYNRLLGEISFPLRPIRSLPTATFLRRLARGLPMHDAATLRAYVDEDVEIIRQVKPDLVVGDFRLSLAASARLTGVPLLAVANAYWSPYGRQTFMFPEYDYPLGAIVGRRAAAALFRAYRPLAFGAHTRPLNVVLRERGLPEVGADLRAMYTFGDFTAYADVPGLVPLGELPPSHRYIGAVLWSPGVPLPAWWDSVPTDRPVVYVTPGSSGESQFLPVVLNALRDLPVTVLAATAGRIAIADMPRNAYVADFLPGSSAAARAALVVCNGGSPTTYQAIAAGVPVLGIVSNNMDQHLNMEAVRGAGAGDVLRARGISAAAVREMVGRLLETARYGEAAQRCQQAHEACRAESRFPELVEEIVGS